jgi:glutaminyl-tRNA synthetase
MVRWLGFTPAKITYSSDDFDQLYELAEKLITRGKAYVCHCTKDAVQRGRGGKKGELPRSVCADWSKGVEKNMEEFRAMRDGQYEPGTAHLRMKQFLGMTADQYAIDKENDSPETKKLKLKLKSLADNPAFWDIAAYRVKQWKKDESKPDELPANHHHRTGDKWKIYPTYEFTHCLVDAFEGITHSLCTVEFETLRPAYNWLLEALDYKLPDSEEKGPMQREYGRLNVEGTILSKRRIAMLVNGWSAKADPVDDAADGVDALELAEGEERENATPVAPSTHKSCPPVVRNWDDPRLFTLVALRRRGVPPGALKKFVLDLGVTKANANTMTHNLDATIRTYLERTVPRLMLVLDPIKVIFQNLPSEHLEERDVPFDPKDPSKGSHILPFTQTIYIDRDDFRETDDPDFFRLAPGKSCGLLHAEHPIRCISFTKDSTTGKVDTIIAEYGEHIPKGQARIHWVGESAKHNSPVRAECRLFNPLFNSTKPNELDWKSGGYYDSVNPESEVVFKGAMIESGFLEVQKRAPWPAEEGEKAGGEIEKSAVRFQGVRTAYFAEDKDSREGKVVLNRIVTLKEDGGKKG